MIRLWSGHAAFFCTFSVLSFSALSFSILSFSVFSFSVIVLGRRELVFSKKHVFTHGLKMIRNFVEMTKKWNIILPKTHYGAILCGFLMSKKRASTLFSTGNVDNLSWIFYGMQVYHITGNTSETDFENCRNNRKQNGGQNGLQRISQKGMPGYGADHL